MSKTKKRRELVDGRQGAFSPSGHFRFTPAGYMSAREWLKGIGEWEKVSEVSDIGFLLKDAWSIIDAANRLWDVEGEK